MKQLLPALLLILLPALTQAQAVRRVMVEEFSNASCAPCAAQNPALNTLLQSNGANVVVLKYQWYFPGYDPMHNQNPTEVNSRATYYGVTGVPNVRLDGAQNAGVASSVTQAMITNRLNQGTPIDMRLDHQLSAGFDSVFIQCTIKNLGTTEFNPGGVVLHTAIIEKQILFPQPPGSTNERDFKSIMRKMLPGVSGAPLAAIPAGDSVTVTYAVALPDYIYNYAQIGVVAFVQKTSGREIYQAVESLPKPIQGSTIDVAITPNIVFPQGPCDYAITPRVLIKNDGSAPITEMEVSYQINDEDPVTQDWTGNLAAGQSVTITFPAANITPGEAEINFSVSSGDAFDYNRMNELVTSQIVFTLNEEPLGTELTESVESAPVSGIPENSTVIRNQEDHFMAVNRAYFGVSQQIGGYAASPKAMFVNFYDWTATGAQSHFILGKVDLSVNSNNYLKFDYAHARYQTSNDRVRVSISTDCGSTWTTIWDKTGAALATAPAQNARFRPTATQWRTDSIALTNFDGQEEVLVRFSAINGYGNDFFLDNIRVYPLQATAADEPGLLSGKVQVYPNPASDLARIDVHLESASAVNISVFDLSGKLVHTIANGNQLGAGSHQFNWAPQAQGIFLVRVATEYGAVTEKLTVVK